MAMKTAQSPKQQSAIKLFICVVILLAVAGLLIVPKFMKNSQLKKEIVQAQNDLKQARKFHETYLTLQDTWNNQEGMFQHLVLPPPEVSLSATDFETTTSQLIQLIKDSNLSPPEEGFEMISGSLSDYENQVLVTAEFTGNYTDAWGFFVKLGELPYVRHIQSIDMEDRFESIACRLALRLFVTRN